MLVSVVRGMNTKGGFSKLHVYINRNDLFLGREEVV